MGADSGWREMVLAANEADRRKAEEVTRRFRSHFSLAPSSDSELSQRPSPCPYVDQMDGWQFELLLKILFERLGYAAELVGGSGDQGLDLIVSDYDGRFGIQAKRHSSPVGNFAVQALYAGIKYHDCQIGLLIATSGLTRSAMELVQKLPEIAICDRSTLDQLVFSQLPPELRNFLSQFFVRPSSTPPDSGAAVEAEGGSELAAGLE
jgi:restriction system protein